MMIFLRYLRAEEVKNYDQFTIIFSTLFMKRFDGYYSEKIKILKNMFLKFIEEGGINEILLYLEENINCKIISNLIRVLMMR